MNASLRKPIVGALAAASLVGALAASTTSAEARWRRGPGIAAGVIGGLALGALAAGAARPYYYGPGPAYYGYGCHIERQPVYDAWGRFRGWQRIRVC
jgi:hypothetical protein